MSSTLTRRTLLKHGLCGFGSLSLAACSNNVLDDDANYPQANFLHGVASGDPLMHQVILWTRLTPSDLTAKLQVSWEIASDEGFNSIINHGRVETSAACDFTVKVDAAGLQPGQRYYYRFKYRDVISVTGRVATLAQVAENVRFAVCSCSNYPAGYFYVYREIAKQDVDVVLHLGDYIYEYGQDGYATEDAVRLGRGFAPNNRSETICLTDYRRRYALYRSDIDLQAAHARHPFIVVWDDHELANDTWRDGAENHQDNEGRFSDRKLAALQAYFEWMPIRPVASDDHLNIYRQFNFANLVELTMLDTRIVARDEQLAYRHYFTAAGFDASQFQQDLTDVNRSLIGYQQRAWLQQQLAQSKAIWTVVGQQVLMAKMLIPAELLSSLDAVSSGQATAATLEQLSKQISELVQLKTRMQQADPTLTEQEAARLTTLLPYNLDAWDGYYAEREMLYQTLRQLDKKVVVLAGDTHNAWYSRLHDQFGALVGVELATGSISSPGMESYLSISEAALSQFEFAFRTLIDELAYCNLSQRGFIVIDFDQQHLRSRWIFVDSIKEQHYTVDQSTQYQIVLDTALQPVNA